MATTTREFSLSGVEKVQRNLILLASRVPQQVAAALYAETQVLATESRRRTPVLTGALRQSHMVSRPVVQGRDISCQIRVGGAAAPYAIFVHENLAAFHKVGRAKFLESAILEARSTFAARVASRINLEHII